MRTQQDAPTNEVDIGRGRANGPFRIEDWGLCAYMTVALALPDEFRDHEIGPGINGKDFFFESAAA